MVIADDQGKTWAAGTIFRPPADYLGPPSRESSRLDLVAAYTQGAIDTYGSMVPLLAAHAEANGSIFIVRDPDEPDIPILLHGSSTLSLHDVGNAIAAFASWVGADPATCWTYPSKAENLPHRETS